MYHLVKNGFLADKNEEEQAATVHVQEVEEANDYLKLALGIRRNCGGLWINSYDMV